MLEERRAHAKKTITYRHCTGAAKWTHCFRVITTISRKRFDGNAPSLVLLCSELNWDLKYVMFNLRSGKFGQVSQTSAFDWNKILPINPRTSRTFTQPARLLIRRLGVEFASIWLRKKPDRSSSAHQTVAGRKSSSRQPVIWTGGVRAPSLPQTNDT